MHRHGTMPRTTSGWCRPRRTHHESAERLGRSPSATRRRSPSSAGRTASRPVRKAASRRSCRTSGASGTSRRTIRRRRACWSHCRSRAVEKMVRRAAATTCRRSQTSPPSRPGPRKGRRRARSTTTRTRTITRSCRCGRAGPPKIAHQIYTQAIQTKMIVRTCRARRWKRRSPGPRARSKASCGPDGSPDAESRARACAPAHATKSRKPPRCFARQ
jgi:hypothetical protein